MKKIGSKGFTLIELLAVITIMGILMLVAIPAVSRTIENSRRDTFMDTGLSYLNAIKNSVAADELDCGSGSPLSAQGTGYYYVVFASANNSGKDLMEQGGKSSWGNVDVKGVVVIKKTVNNNRNTYEYAMSMVDKAGRGFGKVTSKKFTDVTPEKSIKRNVVLTSNGDGRSTLFSDDTATTVTDPDLVNTASNWTWGGTAVASAATKCTVAM